jgi:hypothetical protein
MRGQDNAVIKRFDKQDAGYLVPTLSPQNHSPFLSDVAVVALAAGNFLYTGVCPN